MVHKQAGALALVAALLMSTSAFAQDKRVVTWNADYDPIPLAAAEALIAMPEPPIQAIFVMALALGIYLRRRH